MAKKPRLPSGRKQDGTSGSKPASGANPSGPPGPGRTSVGQFAPGVSGNPLGRPKNHEEFVAAAREISLIALKKLAQIMMSGTGSAQVRAAEIIIERAWGKAAQPIVAGGDGSAEPIEVLLRYEPPRKPDDGDEPK